MYEDNGRHSPTFNARSADLADIAAMDRMAADLQPQSNIERWAQRQHAQRHDLGYRIRRLVRRSWRGPRVRVSPPSTTANAPAETHSQS